MTRREPAPLPAHYAGVPLGGLGTGCIELGEDARFRNLTINNNRTAASRIPLAPGAFVAVRAALGSSHVTRILQPDSSVNFASIGVYAPYTTPDEYSWYGLYPSSNFKLSAKDFPVDIQWSCLSPVIPYDTESATLPLVLCAVQCTNPTNDMYAVSALFNWENLRGCTAADTPADRGRIVPVSYLELEEALQPGMDVRGIDGKPGAPVGLGFSLNEPCTQNAHGNYCLVTPPGSGSRITLQSWDAQDPDEVRSFWTSFNEYGNLTDRISSRPTAYSGSVCAGMHLAPGETRRALFLLAWYCPFYRVDGADLGNAYTNEHDSALSVASLGLKHPVYYQRAVSNWQQRLMKSSLPGWYSRQLLNSCHVFSTNTIYTRSGEFAMMESPQDPALGALARGFYSSFGLSLFFPGLAGKELETIAQAVGDTGSVCNDLGQGTPRKPSIPEPGAALDLVAKFVLLAYRNFHLTGKTVGLMNLYPKLRDVMTAAAKFDRDGDGIPELRGDLAMFPGWDAPKLNSYFAGLWVAASTAYAKLAHHLKQDADAVSWEARARAAREAFERHFWDDDEGCYRFGAKDPGAPFHFAGQLAGAWAEQFLHLDAPGSQKKLVRALQTLARTNRRGDGLVLGDSATPARPDADFAWPALTATCFACPQIALLDADEGLQTLYELGQEIQTRAARTYNQPLMWDWDRHDACGPMQDRHIGALSVWHSLYALTGFWLSVPEQRMVIAPRLPSGVSRAELPLFTPAAFGRLLYEVDQDTARQRFKISFDSPVFIKTIEVAIVGPRPPGRVVLRINDEPAPIRTEIVAARPRNRVKVTLKTPLQVQHPIDFLVE